jgi:cytochrome P450
MGTPRFVDQALGELQDSTNPYVLQIVDEHIDWFAPAGREDLVLRYARPVPLLAMAGLLGMDARYAADVGQAVPSVLTGSAHVERAEATLVRLCDQLVDEKRASPGPDVVSWMLHYARDDEFGTVPQQMRRLLLGVVAHATSQIGVALSSRIPSPGIPPVVECSGIRDGFELPPRGLSLVRLITETAVGRLLHRLPDLRLRMPLAEILRTTNLGLDCPESLPVIFHPVRVQYTGEEEITWVPAPTFTTAPPLAH